MNIAHWLLGFGPVLGAAIGYLADGAMGATSGFLIPVGPLVVGWMLGAR
jgi:hypothetical protein